MEKDLVKFNEHITFLNKDMSQYEDDKGNKYLIPAGQLICNCSYNELDKVEYQKAVFSQIVDKHLEFNEIEVERPVSKEEVTKKAEDRYTIVDKKVKVKQVWIVQNGLKISKSFNSKEEALAVLNEINNKVLTNAEII